MQTTDRYTLADLEHWSDVTRDIDPPVRLGVLGDPVAHSLSPQMQNAALGACDIHMQYARFHIRTNELRSALPFLRRLHFIGVNLTVPHKIAAFTQIDEADESAMLMQLADIDLIVNATPLGMNPSDPAPVPARLLAPHQIVFDCVYGSSKTALLRAAEEAGARGATGLSMFLYQGALSFSIWFNREAPIEAMRAAL